MLLVYYLLPRWSSQVRALWDWHVQYSAVQRSWQNINLWKLNSPSLLPQEWRSQSFWERGSRTFWEWRSQTFQEWSFQTVQEWRSQTFQCLQLLRGHFLLFRAIEEELGWFFGYLCWHIYLAKSQLWPWMPQPKQGVPLAVNTSRWLRGSILTMFSHKSLADAGTRPLHPVRFCYALTYRLRPIGFVTHAVCQHAASWTEKRQLIAISLTVSVLFLLW